MNTVKPVMLIILDGWGIRTMTHGNAPLLANTPNYDRWTTTLERAVLDASGEAVGLVPEQMGNSEVGHLNLGAGRIVYQDISRIDNAIRKHELAANPAIAGAFSKAKANGGRLHLIGLLSDGGVHSHERHLHALLDLTRAEGINPILHLITDGRDTPTESGMGFIQTLEAYIAQHNHGRVASLAGRYYSMDRDNRWERTGKGYAVLTRTEGETFESASAGLAASYAAGVTDEFVLPMRIGTDDSLRLERGDVVLCYNFRSDRMRQMAQLFTGQKPDGYTGELVQDLHVVTMTEYAEGLPVEVAFPPDYLVNTLAETVSKAGKTQYHSAETEKYPHVTFFFNGREEQPFPGEDRRIIPSPKVATYDLQPEMSAYELMQATLDRLQSHDDDFLLVNFANPDMVGHTGSLEAAIKACEVVDECAGKLVQAVVDKGGTALVTADHGNCDRMIDEITGEAHTYHTTQPVAFFAINASQFYDLRPRGILADVAPTVLHLLGIDKPQEMTGESLIAREKAL